MKGFDCSTRLTSKLATQFAVDGYDFVARYLVPDTYSKALTAAEATAINEAGLSIVSVWETTASRALSGYTAGVNDGYSAAKIAYEVGQPEGSTIYAAVDFDARPSDMPTVLAYIRGFSEATPRFTTGVYGSYNVVKAAFEERVCSHFWQTYAWSGGKKADFIQIYQFKNDIKENGIGIDLNDGYGLEGAWNKIKEEYTMTADDANKIIEFLKASWGIAPNTEAKEECRRLANELRKASGQEVQ